MRWLELSAARQKLEDFLQVKVGDDGTRKTLISLPEGPYVSGDL